MKDNQIFTQKAQINDSQSHKYEEMNDPTKKYFFSPSNPNLEMVQIKNKP